MNKLDMLKIWAMGLGISNTVFDSEKFKFAFRDNDPVDSLRAIQDAASDFRGAGDNSYRILQDPKNQLEFIMLMND